jgi:hypothetical protein
MLEPILLFDPSLNFNLGHATFKWVSANTVSLVEPHTPNKGAWPSRCLKILVTNLPMSVNYILLHWNGQHMEIYP